MKKLLPLVILFCMGITPMFAQSCFDCEPTTKAFTIGNNTTAEGLASFAGGNASNAAGHYSFAFGDNAKAMDNYGIALGKFVTSNTANSYVFGMGSSSSQPLINDKPNSIMFGVNHLPSLTILQPPGALKGYLGIGTDAPEEMVHVAGTLLIDRTERKTSRLQFKHRASDPFSPSATVDHYWDIYSDIEGLKFNTVIDANSTQNMIIVGGGYVGIGSSVTTPLAKLHVDRNILAEGDITTFDNFLFAQDNNARSERWKISRTNRGLIFGYSNQGRILEPLVLGNTGTIKALNINIAQTITANSLSVQSATIDDTLTINALSAQSATIIGALTANALNGQSANMAGNITAGGALSAPSANISDKIKTKEVEVTLSGWPDFVFEEDYNLPSLPELEQYIKQNSHLPNIPSEKEVMENGINLGEMNAILIQKVEELTLYILDLQNQINELKTK